MNGLGDLAGLHLSRFHLGFHFGYSERRQEQRGENRDDADDHEQFNQGESRGRAAFVLARIGVRVVFHERCYG